MNRGSAVLTSLLVLCALATGAQPAAAQSGSGTPLGYAQVAPRYTTTVVQTPGVLYGFAGSNYYTCYDGLNNTMPTIAIAAGAHTSIPDRGVAFRTALTCYNSDPSLPLIVYWA
jgi:hypothetical protein